MDQEWNQGSHPKAWFWIIYLTLNYAGSILCLLILWSLWALRDRIKPHDIFTGCLLLGCLLMGIPCASQCLINRVYGNDRFEYGWRACWWEAYFHLEAIQMQFFGVTLVAGCHYFNVVHRKSPSIRSSLLVALGVIVCCAVGTYLMGTISEVVLMPAGAYCFYKFSSPLIVYWFTPGMLAALACVTVFYIGIFRFVMVTDKKVAPMLAPTPPTFSRSPPAAERRGSAQHSPTHPKRLVFARRTSIYVLIFLLGWGPAVVACLYTVRTGTLTEALDITLAMFGSAHTLAVPLVYGYHTRQFRDWLFMNGCCWDARRVVRRRGNRFVVEPRTVFVQPAGELKIVVDTVAVDGSPIQGSPDPSSGVTWVRSALE